MGLEFAFPQVVLRFYPLVSFVGIILVSFVISSVVNNLLLGSVFLWTTSGVVTEILCDPGGLVLF